MKELKLNDPRTWSQELTLFVEQINKKVIDINDYNEVSWVGGVLTESEYSQLDQLLNASDPIRAYHYTRLLPHEIEDVRARGLKTFSQELFTEKVAQAASNGFISQKQAQHIIKGSLPISSPEQNMHRSAVCYTTERYYDESIPDIEHLINYWGGEGIHYSEYGSSQREDLLCYLGTPIVIECLVPIVWGTDYVSGNTADQLVLGYRGYTSGFDVEIHQKQPLAPENIVRIYDFNEFKIKGIEAQ